MNIMDYIQPVCLALIPALYVIGYFFKKSEAVNDKHIPLLLAAAGVLFGIVTVITAGEFPHTGMDWVNAISAGVIQGILCAGAAVFGNQVWKQEKAPSAKDYMEHLEEVEPNDEGGEEVAK